MHCCCYRGYSMAKTLYKTQKPCVKTTLASTGRNTLCKDSLLHAWHEPHEQFLLTLGKWGGESQEWQQTSRRGHNLVLQLNLHEGYRRKLDALLPDEFKWFFESLTHKTAEHYYVHPTPTKQTMG